MLTDLTAAYAELKWRIENDKPSRDQYARLTIDGYSCDGGCDGPATWRRPAMPEKRAGRPDYRCDECYEALPPSQEKVEKDASDVLTSDAS